MKLKYQNPNLAKGKATTVYGVEVKNGDVYDFSKFGANQKHFEQKALNTKLWSRTDEKGEDIEDAQIVEEEKLTAAQIKEKLDDLGVEYKSSASKAELQALLDEQG